MNRTILLVVILRFVLGGFWFEHSHQKWDWPRTGELERRFQRNNQDAEGIQKVYLEKFCLPYWRVLQYLVLFGELAVGLSFLFGYLMKPAALGGAFMALNFLFAQGSLLEPGILGNPYGPVVITATLVAAYGGGETRWSLRAWRDRKRARK